MAIWWVITNIWFFLNGIIGNTKQKCCLKVAISVNFFIQCRCHLHRMKILILKRASLNNHMTISTHFVNYFYTFRQNSIFFGQSLHLKIRYRILLTIWLSGALFKINIFIPPNDSFIGSKITENFKVSDSRIGKHVPMFNVLMLFNFGNHKCK